MTNQSKSFLRQIYRQVRKNLCKDYQTTISENICSKLESMNCFVDAHNIAFYVSVNGEIDLHTLWQTAIKMGKNCYFPTLNEDLTLSFLPATNQTTFVNNQFNIPEPNVEKNMAINIEKLDVMFMPLLAFDDAGNRLGMGAGYYDRTLSLVKPKQLIGVAYEFQHAPLIDAEIWDIPLSKVITEFSTREFEQP